MSVNDWLEGLKVGDEVVVEGKFLNKCDEFSIQKVTRITDKMVFIGGSRFWKKDGFIVGRDVWNMSHIIPVTQEIRDKVRFKGKVRKLQALIHATSVYDFSEEDVDALIVIFSKNYKRVVKNVE